MGWWVALLCTALGVFFFMGYMWATIHDPDPDGSIEERQLRAISIACFLLAVGVMVFALFP